MPCRLLLGRHLLDRVGGLLGRDHALLRALIHRLSISLMDRTAGQYLHAFVLLRDRLARLVSRLLSPATGARKEQGAESEAPENGGKAMINHGPMPRLSDADRSIQQTHAARA